MPHCQKENHDHTAKSKRERKSKKEAALLRKKAAKARALEEELEKEKTKLNNLALAEGFGEYIVGCEEEREYQARFNLNKRSNKHLRVDIRKAQERKEREEEEQRQREKEEEEERKKKKELLLNGKQQTEEEEEEPPEEYLVYICQCCRKKFYTTNQFMNHLNSKKHKEKARLYEEAGVIVTDVQLRKDFIDSDDYSLEEDDDLVDNFDSQNTKHHLLHHADGGMEYNDDDIEDEFEEFEEEPPKKSNLFGAFGDLDDSSSSSSDSDDDDAEDDDEKESDYVIVEKEMDNNAVERQDQDGIEYHDDLDLLEEIIYQNRLQERFYPDDEKKEKNDSLGEDTSPIPFDEEELYPDYLKDDRLAMVQRRLQKRLAAKGIEPNLDITTGSYKTTDAVSIGKTLLQQVMAANVETLESRMEAYNRHKEEHRLLGREFRFARGNSKALASQYTFRIDPADNERRRANVHHTGSHYHMQAARTMQFGRQKGLMARHSAQGSRLQASRMAAKEFAQAHGKGGNIRKTSKKSQQKRRGEAGGSKKAGGTAKSES